jgi:hypothetical protein
MWTWNVYRLLCENSGKRSVEVNAMKKRKTSLFFNLIKSLTCILQNVDIVSFHTF